MPDEISHVRSSDLVSAAFSLGVGRSTSVRLITESKARVYFGRASIGYVSLDSAKELFGTTVADRALTYAKARIEYFHLSGSTRAAAFAVLAERIPHFSNLPEVARMARIVEWARMEAEVSK